MKILPISLIVTISIGLMIVAAPVFAGQSCLTKEETKELFLLRMNLQQAQIKTPECKHAWGAMGCLNPIDLARISYFEAKENGDADACLIKEEVQSSNIE